MAVHAAPLFFMRRRMLEVLLAKCTCAKVQALLLRAEAHIEFSQRFCNPTQNNEVAYIQAGVCVEPIMQCMR